MTGTPPASEHDASCCQKTHQHTARTCSFLSPGRYQLVPFLRCRTCRKRSHLTHALSRCLQPTLGLRKRQARTHLKARTRHVVGVTWPGLRPPPQAPPRCHCETSRLGVTPKRMASAPVYLRLHHALQQLSILPCALRFTLLCVPLSGYVWTTVGSPVAA